MAVQFSKLFNPKTLMTLLIVVGIAASLFLNWSDFVSGFNEGYHAGR